MKKMFISRFGILNMKTFLFFSSIVLVAKIGYSLIMGFPGGTFEDWNIAKNLAEHAAYAEFTEVGPTAYKLPAYSFFLSVYIYIFGEFGKEAAVIAQHILFFMVPLQIINIFRIFNKTNAGILAGYFFIFSPVYFYYSNVLEITNIFIPLFLLWIRQFVIIYRSTEASRKNIILLGIITGVLFLTQVIVVPLVLVLIFALVYQKKLRFSGFVLLFGLASVLYSPWIIRNYVVFDKIILTKTPFWQNIYLSFIPLVNVCDTVKLIPAEHDLYTFHLRKTVNEFEMEKIYKSKVVEVLRGKEEIFVLKAIQNAGILWYVPSRYFYDKPTAMFGRQIFVILLNLLTLFALIYFFRRNRLLLYVSLLLFAAFTAPYMIGHAANMRFKLDFEWYQYTLIALFLYERFSFFRVNDHPSEIVAEQSPGKTVS